MYRYCSDNIRDVVSYFIGDPLLLSRAMFITTACLLGRPPPCVETRGMLCGRLDFEVTLERSTQSVQFTSRGTFLVPLGPKGDDYCSIKGSSMTPCTGSASRLLRFCRCRLPQAGVSQTQSPVICCYCRKWSSSSWRHIT